MKVKKYLVAMLIVAVIFSSVGCSKSNSTGNKELTENENIIVEETKEKEGLEESVSIMALKGPTAMGLTSFFDKVDQEEGSNFEYSIVASPEEIVAAIGGEKVQIAMVPANLAAILYNKGQDIAVAGINTLGVLYLASTGDEVHSLEDLRGKTIVLSGKGATPEFSLTALLSKVGMSPEDVTLEFKSEHTEVVQTILSDSEKIALLPEPFLTVAKTKNEAIQTNVSLNEEWKKYFDGQDLITGVVVIQKELLNTNPEMVEDFLKQYGESVTWVNENTEEAAKLISKYDIVDEAIAKKALPNSNIVLITGEPMKANLSTYFEALYSQEPKSVGGKLPNEEFYLSE